LGFTISQVIQMTTANPAAALGMSADLGSLAVGREADLSILRVAQGEWQFRDSPGDTLHGDTALLPVATVRAGQVIMPDWGPHPWGWQPAPGPRGQSTA
jgi:dihydroorotase